MSWEQIPELLRILQSLPPHGHREWHFTDEIELHQALDNDRLSPALGRWSLATVEDTVAGYSLTEPELNIGRVVIGLGATMCHDSLFPALLHDAVVRSKHINEGAPDELHIGVRDDEPPSLTKAITATGFSPVRTMWKMSVDVRDLAYAPRSAEENGDYRLEVLDLTSDVDLVALTDLHNACFEGSWGFSPNSVAEIAERTRADAGGVGGTPILILRESPSQQMVAYIWITMHRKVGRIEMVGTHPQYRGLGLGRIIFDAGGSRLLDLGAESLVLDVDSENAPAIGIYRSIGLEPRSTVTYYGLEIGKD